MNFLPITVPPRKSLSILLDTKKEKRSRRQYQCKKDPRTETNIVIDQGEMLEINVLVPCCDFLAQTQKAPESISHPQVFELFSAFLKYSPGPHKQLIKNVCEIIAFNSRSVEKHHETQNCTVPQDSLTPTCACAKWNLKEV